MSYLRISEARAMGQAAARRVQKRAGEILGEESERFSTTLGYDVFLSHSFQDANVILGVKTIAETSGLGVYVDWIDDPSLDRNKVTAETADVLRARMRASSSFVYAHSTNTPDSKWMPWEIGYFDGNKPAGSVWILPLVVENDAEFKGQEYLGLYPTIENITEIAGVVNLGFRITEGQRLNIPLATVVKKNYRVGIVFR